MKKSILIFALVVSVVVLLGGIFLLAMGCDGICNSSNHGGTNMDICSKILFPSIGSALITTLGAFSVLVSAVFLLKRRSPYN